MPAPPILWLVLAAVLLGLVLVGADSDGLLLIGGLAALVLTLAAVLRRRKRASKTLARWEREERNRARFLVIVPGLTPLQPHGDVDGASVPPSALN